MSGVDWGQVADFINVIGGLGGVVALIVVFWLKGTFVTKADYDGDKKAAPVYVAKADYEGDKKESAKALTDLAAANAAAVSTVHTRVQLMEAALIRIEASLKALPEIQELHRLAMSLERLTGTVSALDTKLNGFGDLMDRLATMVDRHEEHLLENPRK